jgi:hypothetical protein
MVEERRDTLRPDLEDASQGSGADDHMRSRSTDRDNPDGGVAIARMGEALEALQVLGHPSLGLLELYDCDPT